jgi:hypothetical protein
MSSDEEKMLAERLLILSEQSDAVESYIDEDGELVFEIDYDEFVKMIENWGKENE